MKIAFLGTRGIPARYSGFEKFVQELSGRLVQRGHEATVYNRSPFNQFSGRELKGVRIVRLPTLPFKATDTLVHGMLCTFHALARNDGALLYYCGVGNAIWAWLARLCGRLAVVNVDGADYARAKWSGIGRWWLKRSELWAGQASTVIADNGEIQKRYLREYGIASELIPYGTSVETEDPGSAVLEKLGLRSRGFFLYVSRLTPENGALEIIRAYRQSGSPLPLVVVGDEPYERGYLARLRREAEGCPRIHFTGYLYDEGYRQLSWHARAFFLGSAFDATRPVLLEQMGFGGCVVVQDVAGNREIVGETAWRVNPAEAVAGFREAFRILTDQPDRARGLGRAAQQRVLARYDWERITDQYEELFQRIPRCPARPFLARSSGGLAE